MKSIRNSILSLSPALAFLPLTLLVGSGLAARPAQAQGLALGQYKTTVSGTATITDSGTTASGAYQYYDKDGYSVPLDPTTASYADMYTYVSSTVNVSGGSIDFFDTFDTSTVNVSGGSIGGSLYVEGSSTANVSGGSINGLYTLSTSTLNVSGGSIDDLQTYDTSTVNVSGGSIGGSLYVEGSSTANVSGGSIGGPIYATGTSTLDLFGTGFTERTLGSHPFYQLYSVTGTLQNGNALSATYYDYGGTLEFNGVAAVPAPEASTTVSLGLLLILGVGGVLVARKKASRVMPLP